MMMMLKKPAAFVAALTAMAVEAKYDVEDFNTKLFWKRPEQGK